MPSPTEDLNRLRKALDIASWFMAAGRHSTEAANANEVGWTITMETMRRFGALFADGYVPSLETRAEVVRIMSMFEERAAICQASHNLAEARKLKVKRAKPSYAVDNMLHEDRALRGDR